jgi:hypothetical protein
LGALWADRGDALMAAAYLAPLAENPSALAEAAPMAIRALVMAGAPERAKGLFYKALQGASPSLAWSLRLAWAEALHDSERWKESEREVRLAALEGEKAHGEGHPALAPAWEIAADCVDAQGNTGLGRLYREKALEARSRFAGVINTSSLPHQYAKAKILEKLGQKKEAEALRRDIEKFVNLARQRFSEE